MQIQIKNIVLTALFGLMLTGCASTANNDPLEGFNRGVYKFNDVADKAVIKPVAGAYKAVLPSPVRSGVNNFFDNLGTFVSVINDLLQFKFDKAVEGAGRFVINSTFGVAGLVDVASMDGIEKRKEDFGQTLGHWGVGSGPYLVLPFLGPSSIRDATGLAVDTLAFDPVVYVDDPATRNSAVALRMLDRRAQLLPGSDLLDEAALDPYAFMRDAYMQRRYHQIHDGNPPALDDEYDFD